MEKTNLLFHMKSICDCLPCFGAEATVDVRMFQLEVRGRNRYFRLIPQFTYKKERGIGYTPRLDHRVKGFIGWLPYFNKRWPIGTGKLPFKNFCASAGLRTPAFWTAPSASLRDFIVKPQVASFGRGIRGPFRAFSADPECGITAKEYYEAFVEGKIAKISYWNDKPVCLEMCDMPTVTGNGVHTAYELMLAQANPANVPPERSELAALARYYDISIDEVLPRGKTVVSDFRYGSGQILLGSMRNCLADHASTEVGRQLREAGPIFWRGIPEELRPSTHYSVDAIVDRDQRVWYLEMNCNPMVHPDAYFAIFETLFGPAEYSAPAPPPPLLPGVAFAMLTKEAGGSALPPPAPADVPGVWRAA